jgi:hypothetical protein
MASRRLRACAEWCSGVEPYRTITPRMPWATQPLGAPRPGPLGETPRLSTCGTACWTGVRRGASGTGPHLICWQRSRSSHLISSRTEQTSCQCQAQAIERLATRLGSRRRLAERAPRRSHAGGVRGAAWLVEWRARPGGCLAGWRGFMAAVVCGEQRASTSIGRRAHGSARQRTEAHRRPRAVARCDSRSDRAPASSPGSCLGKRRTPRLIGPRSLAPSLRLRPRKEHSACSKSQAQSSRRALAHPIQPRLRSSLCCPRRPLSSASPLPPAVAPSCNRCSARAFPATAAVWQSAG